MTTILLIDDEPNILNLATAYLRAENYTVHTAADGAAGLKAFQAFKPDLIVLDIMLPILGGLELLQRIRQESNVYVILLTAKSEEFDKVLGLSLGADDYLTKPFSPRELVARIKAALRRYGASSPDNPKLLFRRLQIDVAACQVFKDNQPVELTALEFNLLHTLAQHRGRVLSREQLLEHVWGHDFFGEARVVDVHLGHVRKKIEDDPTNPTFIITVRGVGYRFEDEPR
jgi:two-component system alkaline phosphatase synthesis response regulator PhoP